LAGVGVRDIASRLFIFIVLAGGTTHLLGWFTPAAGTIPVGDVVIVLRSNGPTDGRLRHPAAGRAGPEQRGQGAARCSPHL
jgi:hypothetical protein